MHAGVPADTDAELFAMLVVRWRSMTMSERWALIEQMCVDVELLARTDITSRNAAITEAEISYELARRRYGTELADAAYEHLRRR